MTPLLGRREFVAGTALGVIAGPVAFASPARTAALVFFFDRSSAASTTAARRAPGGSQIIDLQASSGTAYQLARGGIPAMPGDVIAGVTRWKDWVTLRSLFAEHGWRVREEHRLADGDACFAWRMTFERNTA